MYPDQIKEIQKTNWFFERNIIKSTIFKIMKIKPRQFSKIDSMYNKGYNDALLDWSRSIKLLDLEDK